MTACVARSPPLSKRDRYVADRPVKMPLRAVRLHYSRGASALLDTPLSYEDWVVCGRLRVGRSGSPLLTATFFGESLLQMGPQAWRPMP